MADTNTASKQVNRQWVLKSRPQGTFKVSDFEPHEGSIPELGQNQILLKTLYLSFDPTQRIWAALDVEHYFPAVKIGEPMRASGIGQVVVSTSRKFAVGDLVAGLVGWQEYAHFDLNEESAFAPLKIPGFLEIERTLAFSLTGLTAYFGMLDIGKPKAGDTVVVSGAAGATGSIAAQIAKIKGARVIGIAGGPKKCQWLKETIGLDESIDYKNENVEERISELCPNGIDVYFDNVGAEILEAVLMHLAMNARIVICGSISQYKYISEDANANDDVYGVKSTMALVASRGSMTGFIVVDYINRAIEGLAMLNHWADKGMLIQAIDLQEGFENIPQTLTRIFEGKNIGKQLLKVSDAPLPIKQNGFERFGFNMMKKYFAWRNK